MSRSDCEQRRLVEAVALLQLLEDVVGADDRVLDVRAALALEAERLVEIEGDHLAARELDQEVAHGGDADHPRDALALLVAQLGVALADFLAGLAR